MNLVDYNENGNYTLGHLCHLVIALVINVMLQEAHEIKVNQKMLTMPTQQKKMSTTEANNKQWSYCSI